MAILVVLGTIVLVTALYAFGVFDTPYIGPFRIVFYFFLFFFIATLVVGVMTKFQYGDYDLTPNSRESLDDRASSH
ncbi:hypothetical protein [Nitrospira sp. Nam74]